VKPERQVVVPVKYKGKLIGEHRLDLLVEGLVVLELKSVERFDSIFEAQILSYLRMARKPVGLIINFNTRLLKEGIRRYVV
jgi:GxxExxY protein